MPVPSLLAVFAHPDDESLSAGGVLARHAAAGADCSGHGDLGPGHPAGCGAG